MLEKAFTGNCMIRDGFVKPEQYAEYMREYADSLLTQTRPSEHKRRKVLAEGENDVENDLTPRVCTRQQILPPTSEESRTVASTSPPLVPTSPKEGEAHAAGTATGSQMEPGIESDGEKETPTDKASPSPAPTDKPSCDDDSDQPVPKQMPCPAPQALPKPAGEPRRRTFGPIAPPRSNINMSVFLPPLFPHIPLPSSQQMAQPFPLPLQHSPLTPQQLQQLPPQLQAALAPPPPIPQLPPSLLLLPPQSPLPPRPPRPPFSCAKSIMRV